MRTLAAVAALLAAGAGLYLRGYRRGARRGRAVEAQLAGAGIAVNETDLARRMGSAHVLGYDLTLDDLYQGRPGRIWIRQSGLSSAGAAEHVRWEPL